MDVTIISAFRNVKSLKRDYDSRLGYIMTNGDMYI
jgi:hypothetical protein